MAHFKVVVSDDRHKTYDEEKKVLSEIGAEVVVANCFTEDEVIKACRDADGILANLAPITAKVVENLEKCKVISRYGVGYDNVDVAACTRKGIYVANVSDYCAEEVSDHALALLMACARKIVRHDNLVREGKWNITSEEPIYRIAGKTFAFLGYGMIARTLHRKIAGLNFGRVLVYDPFIDESSIKSASAEKVDLKTALKEADYISIHVPLNESTRGMINKEAFDMMKPTAILINTSRGPIIDEQALIDALTSRKINCAGLDVYEKEPIQPANPLLKLDNCVLTDHVSWYSEESIKELKMKAAYNIRDVLTGKIPKYLINKDVLMR